MPMRCARACRGAFGALAVGAVLSLSLSTLLLAPSRADAARQFDVDVDDRVDPVRAGEDLVLEIEVENSKDFPAPGVVVTSFLPPGTSFLAAYRQPDFASVPALVFSDRVELQLGELASCGHRLLPPCRAIWLVLRVGAGVAPGTILESRVVMTSSDAASFPDHQDKTYTSVGSAAIRKARVTLPVKPGRDTVLIDADLARNGLHKPTDPPPPTVDPADPMRIVIDEPGGAVALDVTVPGSALRCRGASTLRCRLIDPRLWRPLGLDRYDLRLPAVSVQRNNAHVLVRTSKMSLPDDFGPVLRITLESGGVTYTDVADMVVGRNKLTYTKRQADGP